MEQTKTEDFANRKDRPVLSDASTSQEVHSPGMSNSELVKSQHVQYAAVHGEDRALVAKYYHTVLTRLER